MKDLIVKSEQIERIIEKEELPDKKAIMLLVACVVLGTIFNLLFFKKSLGVSYPIFILCFYGIFLWSQRDNLEFGFSFGWLLSIPVVMLSLTYLIYSNDVFWILNFIGIPILIAAQTVLLSKSNRYKWFQVKFINDILHGMFSRTLSYIPKPFKMVRHLVVKKRDPGKYSNINKVLTGLLIALPLVIVVVMLLTAADQVFGKLVGKIPKFFEDINFGEFITRLIIIISVGAVSFSYIWSFIKPKTTTTADTSQNNEVPVRSLDSVIVITVLISIDLIYIIFTSIQFAYLFGGIVPEGFTYSEYARRGFFELVLVTLINLVVLLCNINLKKEEGFGLNITAKILNTVLIVCTAIMLISAHYRMFMYEVAYGYTYLRILTHGFMAFILVLLIIALVKVWNERIVLFKAYVITALIAYVLINYANIDMIIAKNNLLRYETTNKIDAYYLSHLSYDTVPIILPLLDDQNQDIHLEIENGLYMKKEGIESSKSWQSFNISKYRAGKILSGYNLKYMPISTIADK